RHAAEDAALHPLVADDHDVHAVVGGDVAEHVGRIAVPGLAHVVEPALTGLLLRGPQSGVDLLARIDRPLDLLRGVGLLLAEPILADRFVGAGYHQLRLIALRHVHGEVHGPLGGLRTVGADADRLDLGGHHHLLSESRVKVRFLETCGYWRFQTAIAPPIAGHTVPAEATQPAPPFATLRPVGAGSASAAVPDPERNSNALTGWEWYHGVSESFITNKINANGERIVSLHVESTSPYRFTVALVHNSGPYARGWYWFYNLSAKKLK